jgi:outer membrane protein
VGKGAIIRYCSIVCLVAFLLLAQAPVTSWSGEQPLTLNKAIRTALENNHEIRAFRSSLSAQKEDIGIARSRLLPRVGFEEQASRTNNPPGVFMMKLNQERFSAGDFAIRSLNNPPATTDFQTSIFFEQPVFVPKSLIGFGMAKREYSARNEDYLRKREEIAVRVVQAFLRLHTAKEYLNAVRRGVEDAAEHVRIAEVRHKNSLGLYSDFLRASTALTESEQKLVSARKDVTVSRRWLGLLIGSADAVEEIADERIALALLDLDHYTEASLARRDIKALEIRYENARSDVRRAEAGYLPMLGVGGGYQFNDHDRPFGSEGESWRLMAFLRWDLFDGANRESERRKAHHKVSEVAEQLSGFKDLVRFRIHEAYLQVGEAQKNAELSTAALKTAEEGRRLVKARFENSLSPMVDLLDVQLSLNLARANLVARENEYRLAVINLSYESGTLLKDLNIE